MNVQMLPITKVTLPDDNVREDLGDLSELAASIKAQGMLEPILVREEGLLVVCGSRRVAAASVAGLKEVPAIVRPFTEQERLEAMIVENLQRASLTPLEEAKAFRRLGDDHGLKQTEIANHIGWSQALVSARLSLLDLPDTVQDLVGKGKVRLEAARQLSKLKDDPATVKRLAKKAAGKDGRLDWEVDQELAKRQRVKDLAKARKDLAKELKGSKIPVLELERGDEYGNKLVFAEGTAPVSDKRWMARDGYVVMDSEEHAKLPCHALAVSPNSLVAVEMCTDPGSHPDPLEDIESEEAERQAKLEAREEGKRVSTEARVAFLRGLMARPRKNLVTDVAWLVLDFDSYGYGFSGLQVPAAELLELELPAEAPEDETEEAPAPTPPSGLNDNEAGVLIRGFAEGSKVNKDRAVLAILFASLERDGILGRQGYRYLSLLVEEGHKASEFEKAQMTTYEAEPEDFYGDAYVDEAADLMEMLREAVGTGGGDEEPLDEIPGEIVAEDAPNGEAGPEGERAAAIADAIREEEGE